jgi:hypothetical protein
MKDLSNRPAITLKRKSNPMWHEQRVPISETLLTNSIWLQSCIEGSDVAELHFTA